ncbi:MAG: hypothetical protein NT010_08730 [Proteobacteria bacterium]|nr:hypothetical protein [Pseudomonadota bacterium]
MNVAYRFSSPQGDIVADDSMLERAFAIGPSEYHEFMTLRDFFDCIKRSLLPEKGSSLVDILAQAWQRPVKGEDIEEIVIRYEKYGTLYQICSIDVSAGGSSIRICVSAALSEPAKQTLEREYELLAQLEKKYDFGYLPRVYKKDQIRVNRSDQVETFLVVLMEWFEGYEEWHFQRHDGSTRAFLWDMRGGYRFLTKIQTLDMVYQASRILTLYYDLESTRCITPWHHGGGDFIVTTSDAGVDVKLITARGYEPIHPSSEKKVLQSLCDFCIQTITKMRLDKWEGMGDSTWADRFILEEALKGFFEGLRIKEARGEMSGFSVADVLKELQSFGANQIESLVKMQLVEIKQCDSSDYRTVLRHLDKHNAEIGIAIKCLQADVVRA